MKLNQKAQNIKLKITQVYIALISKETPWLAKIFAAMAIGYALSPIDLIPDFIPILGYLDDLVILPILIYICLLFMPKSIWESYESRAQKIWENGLPKKWYFAIPIILIWALFIVWLFFKFILN